MTLAVQVLLQGTVGFLIGAGTNDLAIRWIFTTVFSKKKHEIASNVKEVVSKELMSPEKIVARLNSPDVRQVFERDFRREIDEVAARIATGVSGVGGIVRPFVPQLVLEELRAFSQVGALFNDDARTLFARLCADHVTIYLSTHMQHILEETDCWNIIYESIVGYDEKKMEMLTRKVANRELRGVTIWGGVIGALVGVSMSFVMWFIG